MTFKYNVVSELQNYMFSRTEPREPKLTIPQEPKLTTPNQKQTANPFFSPRMVDSLFWCFYVMKNGLVAYEQEPSTFVKEKEEKMMKANLD